MKKITVLRFKNTLRRALKDLSLTDDDRVAIDYLLTSIPDRVLTPKVRKPPRVRIFTLYVLELTGGNWYVGITAYKDVNKRYRKHLSGKGARWTATHPPLRVHDTQLLGYMSEPDAFTFETERTLEFMNRHGVERVRGGKYCIVDFEKLLRAHKELRTLHGTETNTN